MSNDLMKGILKAVNNEYAGCADDGISAGDVEGFIDTGSYALNALISGSIYGGLPDSKCTGLAAESSVGKTFLALGIAKSFQDTNPDGIIIIFESESAISKKMLQDRGLDTKRIAVIPCITIQEFRNQCIKVIDTYEKTPAKDRKPLFFVLDSLGMLSTAKEVADAEEGKETKDMTRSSLVRSAFRVITLRLGRSRIPFVITNHVYANVTAMYGGNEVSGGGGFKYATSTIITMTKAQDKVASTGEIQGSIVTCTAYKSRLTREKLKVKTRIMYTGGLDRYYGLIAIAEEAGLIKKVSNKFEFPDGTKAFENAINKTPEKFWTKELLDQVETFVNDKFTYGASTGEEVEDFTGGDEDESGEE